MGLFTPDKAFEVIVKDQITKLKAPSMKLIDLVVTEVKQTLASGLQKVQHFYCLLSRMAAAALMNICR